MQKKIGNARIRPHNGDECSYFVQPEAVIPTAILRFGTAECRARSIFFDAFMRMGRRE